jgi:hypothetical protein
MLRESLRNSNLKTKRAQYTVFTFYNNQHVYARMTDKHLTPHGNFVTW